MNQSAIRTYRGHLERDSSSTIDGLRQAAVAGSIDAKLKAFLGGVPKPHAPRAEVVPLPAPVTVNLRRQRAA